MDPISTDRYTLYLGDCLAWLPTLAAGSVDLICADLPYGTTACKWDSIIPLDRLWPEYRRVLKPRGAVVLTASQPFTSALVMSNPAWFKYCWIWDKQFGANMAQCNQRPMKIHEDICIFAPAQTIYNPRMIQRAQPITLGGRNIKSLVAAIPDKAPPRKVYYDKYPESIIRVSNRSGKRGLHPTQKPVALMEYLIRTYSNPGDLVLDNAAGSFTTGEAALNTGRRFVGMEQEAAYFAIGADRLARAAARAVQPALLCEVGA